MSDVFSEFEKRPIGTASLAQVHKAKLKDGTVVAVKVQHPRVKPHSYVDMATMEALTHAAAKLFPDFKLIWIAEETKANLPLELDFVNEGKNAERVRRMFNHLHFLKVPWICWELSSDRVLTMEFCEGGEVKDLEYMHRNGISPPEVCRKIGMLYSEMIFEQGYVHCDPHAGNVLVFNDPYQGLQIILLDHGLYTTLTDEFRLNYSNLWLAFLDADVDRIKTYCERMGVGDLYALFACMITARSWESIQSGISKQKLTAHESDEIRINVASYIRQISDVLDRVPRPMVLILKTNDLIRSIEHRLKTIQSAYAFVSMTKCCTRTVHQSAYRQSRTWTSRLRIILSLYWQLTKIGIYESWLDVCHLCRSAWEYSIQRALPLILFSPKKELTRFDTLFTEKP